MKIMPRVLTFLVFMLIHFYSFGQSEESSVDTSSASNKWVLFPLAFYLPETSVGFGGAGAYTYHWKNQPKSANPSQFQFVGTYTLRNQILLYAPFKLYVGNNDYYIFGELGYYKYFYRYYGIGNSTPAENIETYSANYPRFTLNVTKQLIPTFFGGISIWYDQFDMRSFEAGKELIDRNVIGSPGGAVLGLGFRLIHDTRKNIFYPTGGSYSDISVLFYSKAWGSDYDFSTIDVSLNKYIKVNEMAIVALNGVSRQTNGTIPFYHLALHGGPRFGRGYELGRYRDRFMLTFNAEWRQKIKGRLGAVAFLNYGGVAASLETVDISSFYPAFGVGLRYALDKINHLNVRLDYGIGRGSSQFYITVAEAF